MFAKQGIKLSTILACTLLFLSLIKPVSAADWLYTIRPGDTLWSLCQQYVKEPLCWKKLGPLNNIERNRKIPPGTRIHIPATWLKVPAASATIIFTQGEVTYLLPGEKKSPAIKGIELTIGSQLTTKQGSVTISFADGSSMVLESNSHLELDALSNFEANGMVDSSVRLSWGTVKTRVIKREPRSQFRTITPSAVAAVRGTEYRVNVVPSTFATKNKISTLIEVYKGLVDVNAENTTHSVAAGFGIVATQGQALQAPTRLLPKPQFQPFDETQILVANGLDKQVSPIIIEWQKQGLAISYQLNILADEVTESSKKVQAEVLFQENHINGTQINLSMLSPGCYQLSLRGIDSQGLHGLAARKRLCLKKSLNIPILERENINGAKPNQTTITWANVINAKRYRLEVSQYSDFTTLLDEIDVSSMSYTLKHDAEVFVRIQALGEQGEASNYSTAIRINAHKIEEKVAEKEYWPVFLVIGMYLLAIL